MRYSFSVIYNEFLRTLKRPKRILGIFDTKILPAYIDSLRLRLRFGDLWVGQTFRRKTYRTYKDYVAHQKSKLSRIIDWVPRYDQKYREILRQRLEDLNCLTRGATVLCLAARIGSEVKAFLDIDCFAIGIDLNPGKNNQYVLHGDFHHIQFPRDSVDVLFTNSLDHALDIDKLINEIKRVLKPEGLLIVEASKGSDEGKSPGPFESFYWPRIDDLVALFDKSKFELVKRSTFTYPENGEQICFKNQK